MEEGYHPIAATRTIFVDTTAFAPHAAARSWSPSPRSTRTPTRPRHTTGGSPTSPPPCTRRHRRLRRLHRRGRRSTGPRRLPTTHLATAGRDQTPIRPLNPFHLNQSPHPRAWQGVDQPGKRPSTPQRGSETRLAFAQEVGVAASRGGAGGVVTVSRAVPLGSAVVCGVKGVET